MRCLTYALRKWIQEGGYLCIRKSHAFSFPFPHFLHAKKLSDCSHMTGTTKQVWWKEIWYAITGQHYEQKHHDDRTP